MSPLLDEIEPWRDLFVDFDNMIGHADDFVVDDAEFFHYFR